MRVFLSDMNSKRNPHPYPLPNPLLLPSLVPQSRDPALPRGEKKERRICADNNVGVWSASLTSRRRNLVSNSLFRRLPPLQNFMANKRKPNRRKRIQRASKPARSKTRKVAAGKRTRGSRYVYYFGDGHADGTGTMKPLLGGKGANLHEMTRSVCLCLRDSPSPLRCAVIFTITIARIRRNWRPKSRRPWPRSKNPRAKNSATKTGRCSSRCARARRIQCRA